MPRVSRLLILVLLVYVLPLSCFLIAQPSVTAAEDAPAVTVLDTDKTLFCPVGTSLHFAGACPTTEWTKECCLEVDRRVANRTATGVMQNGYSFTWVADSPGYHPLRVYYTIADGQVTAQRVNVHVLDRNPIDWKEIPHDDNNDYGIALKWSSSPDFRVARAEVLFNGTALPDDSPDATVNLPIATLATGTYSIGFDAYDSVGNRYVAPSGTFNVPERVQFDSPGSIAVKSEQDKTILSAKLSPSWKVSKVAYFVNDQQVGTATATPFSVSVNLASFESGACSLKVVAYDASGNSFETPAVTATLINLPNEKADQAVAVAADKAEMAARAEKLKNLRDDVAAMMQQKFQRTGTVGLVHGLAVLETGDGEVLGGSPINVAAKIRRGSGQSDLLAWASADSQAAVDTAAIWSRSEADRFGLTRDWNQWDFIVSYPGEKNETGGPSAGVDYGIAFFSVLSGKPVDSSVAMTGEITSDGRVNPVGGVIFKADYALSNPDIKTLIVPNDPASSDDLDALASIKPELFVGKKIVYARTMEDVIHYAIIGMETQDQLRERNLMSAGINAFLNKDDTSALADFQLAKKVDPIDQEANYWSVIVRGTETEEQKLAPAVIDVKVTH